MTHLVRDLRPDKHGKIVTRWVKLSTGSPAKSVPAPSAHPAAKYDDLVHRVIGVITSRSSSVPEEVEPQKIENLLLRLPRHTLDYLAEKPDYYLANEYLDKLVISALHKGSPPSVVDDVAFVYKNRHIDSHNHMDLTEYESWGQRGFEGHLIIEDVLRGCAASKLSGFSYKYGSKTPLRLRSDDLGSKVIAVFNTVYAIDDIFDHNDYVVFDENDCTDMLTDPALAQLVVDYHERNEVLIHAMSSRMSADPLLIADILASSAKALSEGVL